MRIHPSPYDMQGCAYILYIERQIHKLNIHCKYVYIYIYAYSQLEIAKCCFPGEFDGTAASAAQGTVPGSVTRRAPTWQCF